MPAFRLNSLTKEKIIQMIGEFYDVIDSLKDRKEVELFFRDLLTPEEIATLMRRIEIAVLLNSGFSYRKIIKLLGVGRGKITNVYKCLEKDDSGYKIIVDRLIENRKKWLKKKGVKVDRKPKNPMRKTHPLYFSFLPSILDLAVDGPNNTEKLLKEKALYFTPSAKTKK